MLVNDKVSQQLMTIHEICCVLSRARLMDQADILNIYIGFKVVLKQYLYKFIFQLLKYPAQYISSCNSLKN